MKFQSAGFLRRKRNYYYSIVLIFILSGISINCDASLKRYEIPDTVPLNYFNGNRELPHLKGETPEGFDTIGSPPAFTWAKTLGVSSLEQVSAVAVDSLTRSILAVQLIDSLQFMDQMYHSNGGTDILLFCTIPDGPALLWYNRIYTNPGKKVTCTDIIPGSNGEFFAAGTFTGENLFVNGKKLYRTGTSQDFWLGRFDNNGNCIWIKNLYSSGTSHIAVDSNGGLFLTGWSTFNKYDWDGNLVWAAGHSNFDYQKITTAGSFIYVFGRLSQPDVFNSFYFDRALVLLFKVDQEGNYINYLRLGGYTEITGTLSSINYIKAIKNPYSDSTDIYISGVSHHYYSYQINVYWPQDYNVILYQYNNPTSDRSQAFLFRFDEDFLLKRTYESNYTNPTSNVITLKLSPLLFYNHSGFYSIYSMGWLSESTSFINFSIEEKIFTGSDYYVAGTQTQLIKGGFLFTHRKDWNSKIYTDLDYYSGYISSLNTLYKVPYTLETLNVVGIDNNLGPGIQAHDLMNDSTVYSNEFHSFNGSATIYHIITDPDCNRYICGYYSGIVQLFDKKLNGGPGSFLAMVNPDDHIVWYDTLYAGTAAKIIQDKEGNIWETGYFGTGALLLSNEDYYINEDGTDIYLIKYNRNGQILLSKHFNGSGSIGTLQLTVDNSGNPIFTSYLVDGRLVLDKDHIIENYTSSKKFFVVKATTDGKISFTLSGLSTSTLYYDELRSVTTDLYNNILCAGSFSQGTFTIGDKIISTKGLRDMFLFKVSPEGKLLWLKSAGGATQYTDPYSVLSDKKGNIVVYCNGYHTDSPFYFDAKVVTPPPGWIDGILLAKYSPLGNPLWVKHFPARTVVVCEFMKGDEKGNIY